MRPHPVRSAAAAVLLTTIMMGYLVTVAALVVGIVALPVALLRWAIL